MYEKLPLSDLVSPFEGHYVAKVVLLLGPITSTDVENLTSSNQVGSDNLHLQLQYIAITIMNSNSVNY